MPEYIDREKTRDALYETDSILMRGLAILNQLPAADVVPVRHGRWNVYSAKDCLYICSECNCFPRDRTRYCPNCGARMDKDGDGE